MEKLELWYPLKNFTITQKFGANDNVYYSQNKLKGHPGIDMFSFWGDNIYLPQSGKIYKLLHKDDPNLMNYRAVCILVEGDNGVTDVTEITLGHCNSIECSLGESQTGTIVATEGNTGDVYSAGTLVTKAQKDAGSKAGSHLHLQLRPVERVQTTEAGKQYLLAGTDGTLYNDGSYYLVPLFDNGYNGCIDPMPFFNGKFAGDCPIYKEMIQTLDEAVKIIQPIPEPLSSSETVSILLILKKVGQWIMDRLHL